MKMYKVEFEGNNVVLSREVDFSSHANIDIQYAEGKKIVKSITLFAANKPNSIELANSMAQRIITNK
jgi:hypothetical protein